MIIPNLRVAYMETRLFQVERTVNAMWRDRNALDIQGSNRADIERHIQILEHAAETLRDLLANEASTDTAAHEQAITVDIRSLEVA